MAVAKLGPWSGVDARTIDDRVLNTNPIRGGYNVDVHGGELWWRQGFARLSATGATNEAIPCQVDWDKFVSNHVEGSVQEYLISRYCVLEILSNGDYSIPYLATLTNSCTFIAGSTTVTTVGTAWVLGDVINDPFTNRFYIIVDASGGLTGIIDRPAVYSGTTNTSRFSQLSASNASDACFFKNDITHAANAVWVGPPGNLATAPGQVYLVVCFTGSTDKPVAIRCDATAAVHREFFRDTSPAAGAATALTRSPYACCVHESRLILAGAGDFANNNYEYCVWYSMPRDLMAWHTGIQAVDATPNTIRLVEDEDPITAAKTLGDRLIIHRRYSQEVASYTGAIDIPYRLERNNQNLGCAHTYQVATCERKHFIMTHRGPAIFDGAEVRLFGDEVREIFTRSGAIGVSGSGRAFTIEVFSFEATGRVMFTNLNYEDGDAFVLGYAIPNTRQLIYDVASGQWSIWMLPASVACAGSSQRKNTLGSNPQYRTELVACSGSATGAGQGEILGTTTTSDYEFGFDSWISKAGQTYLYRNNTVNTMPGMIRTGWTDFGSASQKMLTKIEVELRDTFWADTVNHRGMYNPATGTQVGSFSYILQCNVYRDFDYITPVETVDIIVPGNLFDLSTQKGWGIEPIRKIRRSLRSQGDVFAFEFSNLMTTASREAGHQEAVFRIVQALVTFTDTQSPRRVNVNEGRP